MDADAGRSPWLCARGRRADRADVAGAERRARTHLRARRIHARRPSRNRPGSTAAPAMRRSSPQRRAPGARDIVEYDTATGQRDRARRRIGAEAGGRGGAAVDRRLRLVGRSRPAAGVHELETRLAAEHPRRLLGARPRLGRAAAARRRRGAVDADVREVLAGRPRVGYVRERDLLCRGRRRAARSRG